jgi:hypothetical protein
VGDKLRSHEGSEVSVTALRDTGEVLDVYNLRVSEDRTYFVGDPSWGFSVWAHNVCIYKAPSPGMGLEMLEHGLNPAKYENGAYFTRCMELAKQYASYYGEGIVKIEVPDPRWIEVFSKFEAPYISNPALTETIIPAEYIAELNTFVRTLISCL